MAGANPFIGLPSADLTRLQAKYLQALEDVADGGQSYSFPGRTFTRANLQELRDTLAEINTAIDVASGTGRQFAQARVSSPPIDPSDPTG